MNDEPHAAASPMDNAAAPPSPLEIRRAAMDLLARREHSYRELSQKLNRRFDAGALICSELDRLRDEKLQSDSRFAEAYVHSRAQRLYGPLRIRAELRERGIADDIAAAALADAQIDWSANQARLLLGKFGARPAADFREKARRLRFLQYRGFSVSDL